MKLGKSSGTERMSKMTFWSVGDKDKEWKAVIAKETRNNFKDGAGESHSVRPSMIIRVAKSVH